MTISTALTGTLLCVAVAAAAAAPPAPAQAPGAGRRLAFEREEAVWIAAIDGSGAQRLTAGVDPQISPDGTAVAYTNDTSTAGEVLRAIAVFDLAARSSRVLSAVPSRNAFGPVWSPDGKRLLFAILIDEAWQVGLIGADGSGFRVVRGAAGGRSCYGPAWAADGASFFCQDLETIHRIGLDGQEPWSAEIAKLFPGQDLNSGARLVVSPDGRSLLADVDMDEDTTIEGWDGPPPALFAVDLTAATARRLTPKGLLAWDGCWLSPSEIVFIAQHEGEHTPSIYAMALPGGKPRLLVRDARMPSVSQAAH
ncbi:MAG TPA: hypothetical protein VLW17_05855 [Thermoanaerobaculaceae bacterium]|nr:hypothetical protein [Thermoanaerobaculaceae bacterium]